MLIIHADDPYWTAADLHYWGTVRDKHCALRRTRLILKYTLQNDLEWYDPQMATTRDGYLRLQIKEADPINNHNMSFMSGMVNLTPFEPEWLAEFKQLQSWNKFCFTGGLIEVSVQLPGTNNKPYVPLDPPERELVRIDALQRSLASGVSARPLANLNLG